MVVSKKWKELPEVYPEYDLTLADLLHIDPSVLATTAYGEWLTNFGPWIVTTKGIFTDFNSVEVFLFFDRSINHPEKLVRRETLRKRVKVPRSSPAMFNLYEANETKSTRWAPLFYGNTFDITHHSFLYTPIYTTLGDYEPSAYDYFLDAVQFVHELYRNGAVEWA